MKLSSHKLFEVLEQQPEAQDYSWVIALVLAHISEL